MAKEKKCPPQGAPGWMVTYGDLMSLLLTFFVLLLSFASMDVQKFKEMAGDVKEAFGVQKSNPVSDLPRGMDIVSRDFDPNFEMKKLLKKIRESIKIPEKGKVEILNDMRGVVLRITDETFFDRGGAKIRPNAWPVLDSIIDVAHAVKNDISLESHTDDIEYKQSKYKDSWELSAERSIALARYFQKFGKIDPKRIQPLPHGKFIPLVKNDDPVKRKLNRRIEIVFQKSLDTGQQEYNKMFSPTEGKKAKRKQFKLIDIFKLGR